MKKRNAVKPLFMVFLINIIGYGILLYRSYEPMTAIIGASVTALILFTYVIIKAAKMGDPYLFLIISALLSIGTIMLLRIDYSLGQKQVLWFLAAIVCYYATYILYKKINSLYKLLPFLIGTSVLLFILTLVIGSTVNGARNWIILGPVNFQPSELIKILFVLTLSCLFSMPEEKRSSWHDFKVMAVVYLHLAFLVLQREWGISLLFFLIYFVMIYVYGKKKIIGFLNVALVSIAGFVGYKVLYHIKLRVDMWLNPFSDPTGKGFQIVQSLFAIASGSFVGSGFGQGSPLKIPEVYSDFIFSAICEEFGILGGVGVILLYFIFVYRGFKITLSVTNPFDKIVALGITSMFGFQTFIIIGGVIKLIPLTGITLPFISYGGSSLVTGFIALGILQAISAKGGELLDAI